MMHTLSTNKLQKSYRKRKVVKDVSIEVKSGEIVGLLGPNGAGKTTSFYMIVGLIVPDAGDILIDHNKVTSFPIHKRAQLGISYLPQEPSIFRKLTVRENILAILELRKDLNKSERLVKLDQLLEELNVTHIINNKGYELSGGERRRVEIARTLALAPHFILFDEPFAGIDPISVVDIKQIIKNLIKKNIGVLITDHNVRETLDICERAYIVNEGKIMTSGTPDHILNDDRVRKVYLGEEFTL